MTQIALQVVHFSASSEIMGAPIVRLFRMLDDPVPEGPILSLNFYEIDKYVLGTKP